MIIIVKNSDGDGLACAQIRQHFCLLTNARCPLHWLAVCTPINVKLDGLTPRGQHAHCSASAFTSQPEDISSQVQPCYSIQTLLASYFKCWHRTSSHFCASVLCTNIASGPNTRCYVFQLSNLQACYPTSIEIEMGVLRCTLSGTLASPLTVRRPFDFTLKKSKFLYSKIFLSVFCLFLPVFLLFFHHLSSWNLEISPS